MSEQENQPLPKVLIVDDSRMVRASLVKLIRGRFEFREEADGEAGWQALLVDPTIELVLTDIGMPQLDGYGLLERIRGSRVARVREMPVIVISGDEDDSARERARKLGANDFITKGIGAAELVARLDSLTRLAQTQRELEESRAALAKQSPVDPSTGLATPSYLTWRGEQELALVKRRQGHLSVLVIEVDHYDQLVVKYGDHVAQLVTRKLSGILGTKARTEDTVTQLGASQFACLSPGTDHGGCCAFALRMQKNIEKLVMTYREDRIRISVTIGIASTVTDGLRSVSDLIGVATQRLEAGKALGGNRAIGDQGEVTQEAVDALVRKVVSIDQALTQLRGGDPAEVDANLAAVVATLMPLLQLIEARTGFGIPLERLSNYNPELGAAAEDSQKS